MVYATRTKKISEKFLATPTQNEISDLIGNPRFTSQRPWVVF